MNFQEVMNSNGNKRVMRGVLKEIKGEGTTKNGKPFKKVSITDETGTTKNAKIYGNDLPTASNVGQNLTWSLGTYEYTYQGQSGKAFAGFWNANSPVEPTPQAQPNYQDNTQDRIAFAQALNNALDDMRHGKLSAPSVKETTMIYYKILTTRKFPDYLCSEGGVLDQPLPKADPVDDFDDNSEIPF